MINRDLRVSLIASKGSGCGIPVLVISRASDSVRLLMEIRASCYILSIFGNSLFLGKSDLLVVS